MEARAASDRAMVDAMRKFDRDDDDDEEEDMLVIFVLKLSVYWIVTGK